MSFDLFCFSFQNIYRFTFKSSTHCFESSTIHLHLSRKQGAEKERRLIPLAKGELIIDFRLPNLVMRPSSFVLFPRTDIRPRRGGHVGPDCEPRVRGILANTRIRIPTVLLNFYSLWFETMNRPPYFIYPSPPSELNGTRARGIAIVIGENRFVNRTIIDILLQGTTNIQTWSRLIQRLFDISMRLMFDYLLAGIVRRMHLAP